MDKFRAVRVLILHIRGGHILYDLFKILLRNVAASLEGLELCVEDLPPDDFYESCTNLPCLRKLCIHPTALIKTPEEPLAAFPEVRFGTAWDMCAVPYYALLKVADRLEHLEDFELHDDLADTGCQRPNVGRLPAWPETLASLPRLHKKLSTILLGDDNVPEWAAFPPPNVKRCWLSRSIFDTLDHWKVLDAFPGLEQLVVLQADTFLLVDLPLRSLKTLILRCMRFNLDDGSARKSRRKISRCSFGWSIPTFRCFLRKTRANGGPSWSFESR